MKVSLPESMREWVEKQRRQDDIGQKLIEGLESGKPIGMSPDFWAERRRTLGDRVALKHEGDGG